MNFYNPTTGVVLNPGGLSALLGSDFSTDNAAAAGFFPLINNEENQPTTLNQVAYVKSGREYVVINSYDSSTFDPYESLSEVTAERLLVSLGTKTGANTNGMLQLRFEKSLAGDGTNSFRLYTEAGGVFTDPSTVYISVNSGSLQSFVPSGIGGVWVYESESFTGFSTANLEIVVEGVTVANLNVPSWMSYFTISFSEDGTQSSSFLLTAFSQTDVGASLQVLSDRISALGG